MIDPISTDGAFPYLLVCLLRVSNRILNDFFCSESMESRRPEPKGGFDHSGCLAAATPPGGGVWGQGAKVLRILVPQKYLKLGEGPN